MQGDLPGLSQYGCRIGPFCQANFHRNALIFSKWARRDLNPGPRDYESPALTAELQARLPDWDAGRGVPSVHERGLARAFADWGSEGQSF